MSEEVKHEIDLKWDHVIHRYRAYCSCNGYRSKGYLIRGYAERAWETHVKAKTGRWPAGITGR